MSKTQEADVLTRNMPIAEVAVDNGGAWDFRIASYLKGKLSVGDVVVVAVPASTGQTALKTGRVEALKPSSPHRPENVHDIVDKVKVNRWVAARKKADEAAALQLAAEERAGMLDDLRHLREAAEELEDSELKEMVEKLDELMGPADSESETCPYNL